MVDDADNKVRWVKKDAFVMPVLPKSLKVEPVIAAFLHLAVFLELSGDETVDPDWAVEVMEHVGHYLQQLSAKQVDALFTLLRVRAHSDQCSMANKRQPSCRAERWPE